MAPTSRVWIYVSNKMLSDAQVSSLRDTLMQFVDQWKRHGEDLKASFEIRYNSFVVLAVDEDYKEISGCSIDASVNMIKALETQFDVDLTDKLNIPFRIGDHINVVPYTEFQKYVRQGKILPETIVFNNMVTTKEAYDLNWEVPAVESWHKRFFDLSKT